MERDHRPLLGPRILSLALASFMIAHVQQDDFLIGKQQLHRDAIGEMDRHRMHPLQTALQRMQTHWRT
jgi:hypothetical protein